MIIFSDEWLKTLLVISQHSCVSWHHTITWANVAPDQCHQMVSLGHNELTHWPSGDADLVYIKPSFEAMIITQTHAGIHPNKLEIKSKPEGTKPLLNPMLTNLLIVNDVFHWGIHLRTISLEMLRISLSEMSLKITNLRLPQPLPGPIGLSYVLHLYTYFYDMNNIISY